MSDTEVDFDDYELQEALRMSLVSSSTKVHVGRWISPVHEISCTAGELTFFSAFRPDRRVKFPLQAEKAISPKHVLPR